MSLFEFILVMISLVLAIGVTHLLQSVASMVRLRRTLQADWVVVTWMATLFLLSAAYWWSLWDFRGLEWTFPAFFYLLLAPTLLYVGVSLLIGAGDPALRGSAGESFEQVRLPFLGVMGLFHVLASVDGLLLGAETAWNSLRFVQLMTFAAYGAGMLWAERRVQRLVAGAVLGIYLFNVFGLRYLPGAFG